MSILGISGVDYNNIYAQNTGVERVSEEGSNSEAFSGALKDALYRMPIGANYDAATGMMSGGGFLPMPALNNTLEQAIMTASSTGNSSDAMLALVMLMMMMQSGDSGGGEMTAILQMMAGMIGQMKDKDALRDNFMYSSGASPYTLDTIDRSVFGNKIPDVSGTTTAVLPLEWWRPTTPAIVNGYFERSAYNYRRVINQFDVENAERYRPGREGNTYCNVYVWDVTRAMGAEIPYYTDPETAAPREYPDTKGANYMGARAMDKWLKTHGNRFGWRQATAQEAQMYANYGKPAVASGGDIGHISMICPSADGGFDPIRGVTIAQAGSTVTNYMHISGIYGAENLKNKVTYWVHD